MTELPPLPETEWLLHMPARPYEPEWTSSQQGYDESQMREYAEAYAAAAVAKERERCAAKVSEYARKWWTEHCRSNHHMATTRKAHDDFCRLQSDIRATQATPRPPAAS